jgi:hypothetical protein
MVFLAIIIPTYEETADADVNALYRLRQAIATTV